MQREKLAQVTRQYQQCRDLGDFKRMIRIARARHAELEIDIRQLYKSKLTEEERERVLTPMRQERNWHLEVIQAVSEN